MIQSACSLLSYRASCLVDIHSRPLSPLKSSMPVSEPHPANAMFTGRAPLEQAPPERQHLLTSNDTNGVSWTHAEELDAEAHNLEVKRVVELITSIRRASQNDRQTILAERGSLTRSEAQALMNLKKHEEEHRDKHERRMQQISTTQGEVATLRESTHEMQNSNTGSDHSGEAYDSAADEVDHQQPSADAVNAERGFALVLFLHRGQVDRVVTEPDLIGGGHARVDDALHCRVDDDFPEARWHLARFGVRFHVRGDRELARELGPHEQTAVALLHDGDGEAAALKALDDIPPVRVLG